MPSEFNGKITADGSSEFPVEAGRYHLYGSYVCPFACRVTMARALMGLEDAVTMDIVDYAKVDNFWAFNEKRAHCTRDTVNNCKSLRDVYRKVDPEYSGTVSVPLLWDKKTNTIVSNDSGDLLHMFLTEMKALSSSNRDLYPSYLKDNIEEQMAWVKTVINLGVYKPNYTTTQEGYDAAAKAFFDGLDKAEAILAKSRYMAGNQLTEVDICLFVTLARFDWAYHILFKLDKKRVVDYPNLWGYMRDIYQIPKVADTVVKEHIRLGYHTHPQLNKSGIVSLGPDLDWYAPHGREELG